MNCKKCNAQIPEGSLICPACYDKFVAEEQREYLENARADSFKILKKSMRSGLFLTVCIFMTVFAASNALLFLTQLFENIFVAATYIIPSIFSIIACVNYWIAYGAQNEHGLHNTISKMSIFDAYQRVWLIICTVFAGLASGASALLMIEGVRSAISSSIDPTIQDLIKSTSIVAFVSGLVGVAFLIWSIILFARRRHFFLALSDAAYTHRYPYAYLKAPCVSSWIYGVLTILGGLAVLAISSSLQGLLTKLLGVLVGSIEGATAITGMPVITGSFLSGLNTLSLGLYVILSALFMSSVAKKELRNHRIIVTEEERYKELLEASKAEASRIYREDMEKKEAARIEREKKEKEEALRLAKQEEEKKQKENANMQQEAAQQMMQQMSQQMMQQMLMQQMLSNMTAQQAPAQPQNQNLQLTPEQLKQVMDQLVSSGLVDPKGTTPPAPQDNSAQTSEENK